MGKFEDLSGQRFGDLTVIKRCEDYVSIKGVHRTQWLCMCNCGRKTKIIGRDIKNGKTKSCGHCNDIEFVDPFSGIKHKGNVKNICNECGFRYGIIANKLRNGFTFEEAVKIKSMVRINKIYKISFNDKYFEGNLKELCEYFNKDYNQVYEFMVYNRTLEWALEHSNS